MKTPYCYYEDLADKVPANCRLLCREYVRDIHRIRAQRIDLNNILSSREIYSSVILSSQTPVAYLYGTRTL